jgi:hypothetical protein
MAKSRTARAQAQAQSLREIRAQAFVLEDERGAVVGRFRAQQPTQEMKAEWRYLPNDAQDLRIGGIQLLDNHGRILWSAPTVPVGAIRSPR